MSQLLPINISVVEYLSGVLGVVSQGSLSRSITFNTSVFLLGLSTQRTQLLVRDHFICEFIFAHNPPFQFQSQCTTTWQVPSVSLSSRPRILRWAGVQVLSYFKPVLLGMIHWYVHNLILSLPPTNKRAGRSLLVPRDHCISLL